jgi:hypothetical protein
VPPGGDHRAALADFLAIGRIFDALSLVNPVVPYPAWRSGAALEHHALGEGAQALDLARARWSRCCCVATSTRAARMPTAGRSSRWRRELPDRPTGVRRRRRRRASGS